MSKDIRTHNLSIFVANRPGALVRIAQAFSRRGFNIESLVVSPGARGDFSRMTITAKGNQEGIFRNDHDKGAALLHRLHLPAQELGLRPGLPDMRCAQGSCFVVSLKGIPAHVHAGREHEPIPAESLARGQPDGS